MHYKKVGLMVFYDEHNRILLQNRIKISKWGEEWGFFGGSIESDETPEETVKREIKEELTYDLENFIFVGNCRSDFGELILDRYVFATPIER